MEAVRAASIFTPAGGFIRRGGFAWTCNPYLGCTYGCRYCYAAFLPQNRRPAADWGRWLVAKSNAPELARRTAHRVAGQAVYLSSVTDPYLPAERTHLLTRGVLEAVVPHQPRLVVQTRGPLVVRDVDLFAQLSAVRVNVTVPTDDEAVRRLFEPKAPPLEQRWLALEELAASGIPVGVCVTPTLPVREPGRFADRVAALKPAVVVTQQFHAANGFGADTAPAAVRLRDALRWGEAEYRRFVQVLAGRVTVYEGEAGFFPPAE